MAVTVDTPVEISEGVRSEYVVVSDDIRLEVQGVQPIVDIRSERVVLHLTNNHRSQDRVSPDVTLAVRPTEIDGIVEALLRAKAYAES